MKLKMKGRHYRFKQAGGFILAATAILLIVLLQGCGGGGGGSSSGKGSIEGKVRNSEGTALPHATVTAGGKNATTDNDGNFTINDVSAGTQTVSASLAGYFNDGRGSASVQVVDKNTTSGSSLILVPTSNGEVFIWHLAASSSDYDSNPQQKQLGGTIYYDSLFRNGGWIFDDYLEAIYSLGRRYSRFKATIGVADDESDLTSHLVFKVIGDGNTLYQSEPLKVGMIDNVDVDVSNVLTLQLQVYCVDDEKPAAVWGNARLSLK
ncbi:MAG: NPCBM/NEW2 domain-containing protein [Armatimonadota bacterium]